METRISTIDLGNRSYDITIGSGLLYNIADHLPEDITGRSIFIITDENVTQHAEIVSESFGRSGAAHIKTLTLPAGEQTKSFDSYQKTCAWVLENGLDRKSMIVAVGGGVIGDLAGFVASSAMRGVDFVQVPTTLLSQVDSSVGGKTGINTDQGKNLIGAFYQPKAVIADIETLKTLPKRQLLAGYAEIVKYGLINDSPFFYWLEENGEKVCNLDEQALIHAVEKSVNAKAMIVEADETEQGRRALLNLGHTFGHALEATARYDGRLLHGEAVSIGTVMAFDASARAGLCSDADKDRAEAHFTNMGLPTSAAQIDPALNTNVDSLLKLMAKDKKAAQGTINFILVNAIGDAFVTADIDKDIIRAVIKDSLISETTGIKERWKSAFS